VKTNHEDWDRGTKRVGDGQSRANNWHGNELSTCKMVMKKALTKAKTGVGPSQVKASRALCGLMGR